MIGMHFNKDIICRTCVKSDVELTSLYGKLDTFDEICYSELITEFTMYSVQEDDELPQNICWECINEAKIAYNFKKKCQESHRKLLALIDPTKNVPDHPTDSIYFGMSDHLETQIPNTIVPMMGNESTASTSTQIMPRRQKDNTLSNQSLICPMCCIEFVTMEFLTRHLNDFHKNAEPIDEKPVFEITIKSEPDDAPMVKLESELDSLSEQVGLEEPPMDIKIEIEENPTHVPDPIPETNNSFKVDLIEDEDPAARKRRLANERQNRWRVKQSEESPAKIRAVDAASLQKRFTQMTSEQLAAHRAGSSAAQQRYIASLSPHQLEAHHANNAASQRQRMERIASEKLTAHRVASQQRCVDTPPQENREQQQRPLTKTQRRRACREKSQKDPFRRIDSVFRRDTRPFTIHKGISINVIPNNTGTEAMLSFQGRTKVVPMSLVE